MWNLPSFSFLKNVSGIQTLRASVIVRYLMRPESENVRLIYEFLGLRVKRLELDIRMPKEKCWNQYLGPSSDNVY